MRVITSVHGKNQNLFGLTVRDMTKPGHPSEEWEILIAHFDCRVSCVEDMRGNWCNFTTTCASVADALDIALTGRPSEEE